jgi:succinate dehydrogenase flavin-adding protein (antitoxin of CptAB toxin-antitoxin module)
VQRRQVLEHDLVLVRFRRETVDRFQLGQRDVAFAILRGADFALDGVAGAQVEATDL